MNPYPDSGLDDVFIDGPDMRVEEDGEAMLLIRAVGRLHRAIAEALVTRPWPLSGPELRFLRTEIGEDPESFAATAALAADALRAAEKGAGALDPAAEDRIRLLAVERLELPVAANDATAPRMARPSPAPAIVIEATGERSYAVRPLDTPAETAAPVRAPTVPSPVDVLRTGFGWLQTALDSLPPPPVMSGVRGGTRFRSTDRSPLTDEEARVKELRKRLPKDLPGDLLWAPVAKADLGASGLRLVFLWLGEGVPSEPRVEVYKADATLPPPKVKLTPESGTLAVQLPPLGPGPHRIASATPDAETLVIHIDPES